MKLIVLVACVSKKGSVKAPAVNLYKSPLFKSSMAYAKSLKPDRIYILSALHHLLEPETEIKPYNVTLSNIQRSKRKPGLIVLNSKEKVEWGKVVIEQLSKKADLNNDKFIILAGQEYIKPIAQKISHLHNPLVGLRQGERVKFLNQNS